MGAGTQTMAQRDERGQYFLDSRRGAWRGLSMLRNDPGLKPRATSFVNDNEKMQSQI